MAQCHIVPLEWTPCCPELRLLWRRWEQRGQLIDLDVARAYFRPTTATIDLTTDPPTLSPSQPHPYH